MKTPICWCPTLIVQHITSRKPRQTNNKKGFQCTKLGNMNVLNNIWMGILCLKVFVCIAAYVNFSVLPKTIERLNVAIERLPMFVVITMNSVNLSGLERPFAKASSDVMWWCGTVRSNVVSQLGGAHTAVVIFFSFSLAFAIPSRYWLGVFSSSNELHDQA